MNTPSVKNIQAIFSDLLGIDVTAILQPFEQRLCKFIKLRGDIAHKGVKAGHVTYNEVLEGYNLIHEMVEALDNGLAEILKAQFGSFPWKRKNG